MESLAIHQVKNPSCDYQHLLIGVTGYVYPKRFSGVVDSQTTSAGGIWTTYGVIHVRLFIRKPELHTPALIWFLTACAADVLITVVLVIALVGVERQWA